MTASASVVVLTNPKPIEGINAIDPKGLIVQELVPNNAVSKAEIIALPTFRSVQVFGASGEFFMSRRNIISFTQGNDMVPDVELTFEGSDTSPANGAAIFNSNFTSSDGVAIRREATNSDIPKSKSMSAVLKFGNYDTKSKTFTPAGKSSGRGATAVAFTLTGLGNRNYILDSIVVKFKDWNGLFLETQSLTKLNIPNDAKSRSAYFAYKSTQKLIVRVDIKVTTNDMVYAATPVLGLDDLGFAFLKPPLHRSRQKALR
jgi:hypothetical protein